MSLQGNQTSHHAPRLATNTHRLHLGDVPHFFLANKVTADRIAKIELKLDANPARNRIELGIVASGLSIQRKTHLDVYYESPAFIGSIVRSHTLRLVEGSPAILAYDGLIDAVDALSGVRDPKRNCQVSDLYAAVPLLPGRLTQFVFDVKTNQMATIGPALGSGIGSVRVLSHKDALLGIRFDDAGRGCEIVSHRTHPSDIASLQDQKTWTVVAVPPTSRGFASLSRPKMSIDGKARMVVTLEEGYEINLTLIPESRSFAAQWGDEILTHRSSIGFMSNSNAFASYVPAKHGMEASIEIAPCSAVDPIALKYLET